MKHLSILALSLMAISCATIFHGTSESIRFGSHPTGAKVFIDGQYYGITPLQMKLESKREYRIEFQKENYSRQTIALLHSVSAGYVILDILFGLIPVAVDAATGAWYSLDKEVVTVDLEKGSNQDREIPLSQTDNILAKYGFKIDRYGKITDVIEESLADSAGLKIGMRIKQINDEAITIGDYDGIIKLFLKNTSTALRLTIDEGYYTREITIKLAK